MPEEPSFSAVLCTHTTIHNIGNAAFTRRFSFLPVVGYTTSSDVEQGQYLALGTVFTDVSGSDIAIKDLFSYAKGAAAGAAKLGTSSDQIWRWDTANASWIKYFYYTARGKIPCWSLCTEPGVETTDTIPAGETFFFLRGGTAKAALTLAGAVKELSGVSQFTVEQGQLSFAANPFPVAMNISAISDCYTVSAPAGAAKIGTSADQIWRWDTANAGWIKYFYYTARGKTPCWSLSTEPGVKTTDTIPAGEGFFFQRGGTATATISLGM